MSHDHDTPELTKAQLDKARETLAAGRLIAKKKAPYFRALLLSFVPREMPGLGTIGIAKNGIVIWDPAFILQHANPEQAGGLWLHECMHRIVKTVERRGSRDPKLWNWASDLAINNAVLEMDAELPTGDAAPMLPVNFGFPDGLTADDYYDLLLKEQEKQGQLPKPQTGKGKSKGQGSAQSKGSKDGEKSEGEGGGGNDADHDNEGQDPNDKPHAAGGWCGSCAGRPIPGEPEQNDPDGRGEGEMERLNKETAEAIKDFSTKGIGKIPGSLRKWAEDVLKPAQIPWRKKLAALTKRAVAWRPGAVDHRYDAPSRRQAGLGYGIGKAVLPRLRTPVPRVSIVVDTSGSMGTKEVEDALTEVNGILKAVGAEVDFCACDAAVHELKPIVDIKQALSLLKGGGGTDFRPAFDALGKQRPRPEVIIFATDGYGPAPEMPLPGVHTIWLLVGGKKTPPALWGDAVVIED